MRMSCNGCRVLRKGCSDNCSIRPCLQWIKSAESQANATVFLAKFYGRAGLMNLLNAGADHLRPAIFRSLLYEACGRIVNPINGSVGLLWSGNWHLCQAAVEAVMRGAPVTPIACDAVTGHAPPFNKVYDIRHVSRDENSSGIPPIASNDGFKHTKSRLRSRKSQKEVEEVVLVQVGAEWGRACGEKEGSPSHDSSLSHQSSVKDEGSMVSEETTVEPSYIGLGLELTLGLEPVSRGGHVIPVKKRKMERCEDDEEEEDKCRIELGLVSE